MSGPQAPPASRTLVPLYLSHGVLHVLIGIYPAVLLVLRGDFQTDFATLGAVFTAATFLYGIGSIPTGFIVNRIHPLTIVRAYLLVAAGAATLIAVAPNEVTMAVVEAVRKAKAEANLSMRAPIRKVTIAAKIREIEVLQVTMDDVTRMLHVQEVDFVEGVPETGPVFVETHV